MSLSSTLNEARPGSPSLRTTVPEGIVAFLGLGLGDRLSWTMELIEGERVAFVRKAKAE